MNLPKNTKSLSQEGACVRFLALFSANFPEKISIDEKERLKFSRNITGIINGEERGGGFVGPSSLQPNRRPTMAVPPESHG